MCIRDRYCSTALERCLLKNCMEGLLRRLPDGTMAEGCAENYSVSADGLRYTFTLRENLQWSDGEPLTAKDFVFAFQRIQQGSGSAAAREQFAAIAGMAAGESGSLGVAAPDDRTGIITPVSYTHLDVYKRQTLDGESWQVAAP